METKGSYKNRLRYGFWKEEEDYGQTAEGNYIKDLREGSWKIFSRNGKLHHEGIYKAGKKDWPWKYFDTFKKYGVVAEV